MDIIKKLWPWALKAADVKSLVITIVVCIVADFVCGLVIGLLSAIPLIGVLFSIVGWVVGVYFLVGIVLAVLNFLGVLKN